MNMNLKAIHLPEIEALRRRCKALAMLDALICPEWDYRYYSFNANWSTGEEMASMRNGQGDEWFLLFDKAGAALKGFAHDSDVVKSDHAKRIQIEVPPSFSSFLSESAFSMDDATFCYWQSVGASEWSKVSAKAPELDDGSTALLALLIDPAEPYVEFANDYFEKNISVELVRCVYSLHPIDERLVSSANSGLAIADALTTAREIGYPIVDELTSNERS
ncbi:hypothetical protein RugamoR57_20190 [Duganella caerulea]|uniref:hypothetical protein n=1 Tax=Duganella caerulea TaxID=2885762 RepID=UPI0030E91D0D